jgi:hypothetical protein
MAPLAVLFGLMDKLNGVFRDLDNESSWIQINRTRVIAVFHALPSGLTSRTLPFVRATSTVLSG